MDSFSKYPVGIERLVVARSVVRDLPANSTIDIFDVEPAIIVYLCTVVVARIDDQLYYVPHPDQRLLVAPVLYDETVDYLDDGIWYRRVLSSGDFIRRDHAPSGARNTR